MYNFCKAKPKQMNNNNNNTIFAQLKLMNHGISNVG